MTPLGELTIRTLSAGLSEGKFSALEIAQDFFSHIKACDKDIGAYVSLNEEKTLFAAEAVDVAIAEGKEMGSLAGVPLAIKDNILIEGGPATAASRILENYQASYDAEVIRKLKRERALFLGKTNLDEFAMGASTENSGYQLTRNPHDASRVPGGSSGGSAAAVAAHMALAALGSDTGGSIRQPAAFCGVVGLKPTYGAVSRSGLIAMASSLDQIGPIAKTVEDAAILFDAIRGPDPLDATSASTDCKNILPSLDKIRAMTVGLPDEYFIDGLEESVRKGLDAAIQALRTLGVTFKKISLPHTKYALSAYYIIVPAEVSSNLARFDGVRYCRNVSLPVKGGLYAGEEAGSSKLEDLYFSQRGTGFGKEAKRRIILGTFVLSSGYYDAYYEKAQRVRALVARDFEIAFKSVDVILAPVTPTPAFAAGEKSGDPLSMYLSDIFTIPANLAGLPALSIPVKPYRYPINKELPIGFQLIGKQFQEADILGLGGFYEKITAA